MTPANGLRGLRVCLRKLDKEQNGMIEPKDFKFGLKTFGIEITEQETFAIMKFFDPSRQGKISVNEMFHAMRSSSLNEARQAIVE